jgi:hypothetical protein
MMFLGGANSALPCTIQTPTSGCNHGTMVAASAVMAPISLVPDISGLPAGSTFNTRGVASGANIIAIKAGTLYNDSTETIYMPDLFSTVYALDYTFDLAQIDKSIAAINLSSIIESFAKTLSECQAIPNYDILNGLFGQFKAIGVATFVATGNEGENSANFDKIAAFSCTQNAIAISATKNNGSSLAYYANNGPLTDLLAPGGDISQVIANGGFTPDNVGDVLWMPNAFDNSTASYAQGTSFATPMAAGAFAVLREKYPTASVDSLVRLLKITGKPVVDTRTGYTVGAKPLIQLNAALSFNFVDVPNTGYLSTNNNDQGSSIAISGIIISAISTLLFAFFLTKRWVIKSVKFNP